MARTRSASEGQQGRGQAAAEARGLLGEVEREVGKRPPMARAFRDQERLHQGNKLAPVFRFDVRIHVRIHVASMSAS